MRRIFRRGSAAAAIALAAMPASAQVAGKKPVTQDTYDVWRTITTPTVSPDGQWVAYSLQPTVGDGELVIRSTKASTEYRVPRGYTGRAQLQPAANPDSLFQPAAPVFSGDSKYVAVVTYPVRAAIDNARRARKRPADQPKNGVAIVVLADGKVVAVPRVKSFRVARDGGRYLAYLLDADSGVAPAARGAGAAADTDKRKDPGTTLVLRVLATGAEERIDDVVAFAIDEQEKWLGYTVSTKTGDANGAYVKSLAGASPGAAVALAGGIGNYKLFAFDRKGMQASFVSDRDDYRAAKPKFAVYYAALSAPRAEAVVTSTQLATGLVVADRGSLGFTRDGSALQFGVAPTPVDTIPTDSLAERANYDLWHWKDLKLQPQQKLELARDRNRTFTTLWQVATRKVIPLADEDIPQVQVADNGRVALGVTAVPYLIEEMWAENEAGSDVHVFDATTGTKKLVATKVPFRAQLSPGAKFVTWYDDHRWWAYDIGKGTKRDLTGAIKDVRFEQEDWSTPSLAQPWGLGGWTPNDGRVLVYDRWDVWEVDPTAVVAPRNLTDGVGRQRRLQFRVARTDFEEPTLDPAQPLILSALDSGSKDAGFWTDRIGAATPPAPIVMSANRWGAPLKARKALQYVVTKQSYRDFPNLWTGDRLDQLARISDANPQQAEYPWGTVELVSWRSSDNVPLRGLLYKPEGFDPTKQYPMLVYFYEQHSNDLNAYVPPAGRNNVNPTTYTAHGYLVFMPDIHYLMGYPGQSALRSVVPGVQSLIAAGFVNPKQVGITGQSWGGYQTAYIVTQTSLFAAAVPNATVANMTSAYGGIRWESGLARSFQYEKSQSRIGCPIWSCRDKYIENSPLFYADKITTPLLFMANDNDGAVPWYQGIEFFVALRRLQKEAYLVVYNGEGHNPSKRADQKDIDGKMQAFFAHHLKGEPAPDWMVKGIPMLKKGRDQVKMAADDDNTPPTP